MITKTDRRQNNRTTSPPTRRIIRGAKSILLDSAIRAPAPDGLLPRASQLQPRIARIAAADYTDCAADYTDCADYILEIIRETRGYRSVKSVKSAAWDP
jgi:hypothetical protein